MIFDSATSERYYRGAIARIGSSESDTILAKGGAFEWTAHNADGVFLSKLDKDAEGASEKNRTERWESFAKRCKEKLGRRFIVQQRDMTTSRNRLERQFLVDLDDQLGTAAGCPPDAFYSALFGVSAQCAKESIYDDTKQDIWFAKNKDGKTIRRKMNESGRRCAENLDVFGRRCADELGRRFTVYHESGPSYENTTTCAYAIDLDDLEGSMICEPPCYLIAGAFRKCTSTVKTIAKRLRETVIDE